MRKVTKCLLRDSPLSPDDCKKAWRPTFFLTSIHSPAHITIRSSLTRVRDSEGRAADYEENHDPTGMTNYVAISGAGDIYVDEHTPTLSATAVTDTLTVGDKYILQPTCIDPIGDHRVNTLTVDWGDETTSVYACDGEDNAGGPYTHVYATDGGFEPSLIASAFGDDLGITGTAGIVDVLKPTLSISADGDATALESGQQPAILEITRTGTDFLTPLKFEITSGGSLADQLDPHDVEGGRAFALVESDGELQEAGQEMTIPVGQATEMLYVYPLEDHTPRWTSTVDVTLSEATAGEDYTLASASPGSPPNSAAGVYVVNDDAYAWLGNGSDNDIFEGGSTADGGTLIPLVLDLPEEVRNGAEITLVDNAPTEADVYTSPDPGDSATPILGDVSGTTVSEITWTQGVSEDAPSGITTLWVEGISGSASINDISFVIYDSDAGCGADGTASDPTLPQYDGDGVTPTYATTSLSGDTNGATEMDVEIDLAENPNGGPSGNISGDSSEVVNWLVGQMVTVDAVVHAPSSMLNGVQYQWTTPPGNVLERWVTDSTSATPVPISDDDGGAFNAALGEPGIHTGLKQETLQFFWVSTSTGSSLFPDLDNVTLRVTIPGEEAFDASASFNVFAPLVSSQSISIGTPGFLVTKNMGLFTGTTDVAGQDVGMALQAKVSMPHSFSGQGVFNILQLDQLTQTYGDMEDAPGGGKTLVTYKTRYPATQSGLDYRWPLNQSGGTDLSPINPFNSASGWNTSSVELHYYADSPGMSPESKGWTSYSSNEAFTDYIMFLPPGSQSQWVPLEYASWGYHLAAWKTNGWQWQPGGNPGKYQIGFVNAALEPRWSFVINTDTQWVKG